MSEGLLALADDWQLVGLAAGAVEDPGGLPGAGVGWLRAQVPGTVAAALEAAGRPVLREELDGLDWWYRCALRATPGAYRLELAGVATHADVWLNGRHVLRTDNMHRAHSVDVELTGADSGDELVVRCAALAPVLARRRPRPRWKTYLVDHQQLRWVRTSLLGRIPGWAKVPPAVGLWREATLRPLDGSTVAGVVLEAFCDDGGPGGRVVARFELPGATDDLLGDGEAQLEVGGVSAPLATRASGGGLAFEGTATLPEVERWWPHTHGAQPRYEVRAQVGGRAIRLGAVGFRTLELDRRDGAFRLSVNGVPIFCRGATWLPPDPVSLNAGEATEARLLGLARDAGLNMLRVPGTAVYERPRFFERCDELGILVWQDCMFAFMDPPDEDGFVREAEAEVREALGTLRGRPCVAVVCGNQEVEEVAAMFGLPAEERATPLFDDVLAAVAADVLPGVPYVTSNPSGGDVPFRMAHGVSQYFGVGGYLRPLDDPRRSRVRFAGECLVLATPPEPVTVEELCGGAWRAGHDPQWKEGVHHDAGRSWDMEDVRDHYVAALFSTDPRAERYRDAERALELGRAANARMMEAVFTEWRHPGSPCDGGLVVALSDLRPGAGWGIVDAAGRPKAPWFALKRVLAPIALLATDEGLNGLALHVVNDTAEPLRGELSVELVSGGSVVTESRDVVIEVPARGAWSVGAEEVLGAWRDVTYAYRFAPPAHDAVVATLRRPGDRGGPGTVLAQVVHLPLGQARPLEADVGLSATAGACGAGRCEVVVRTERLAQWVVVRADGYVPDDSWFHLPPGGSRTVELRAEPGTGDRPPRGTVRALNAALGAPIREGPR